MDCQINPRTNRIVAMQSRLARYFPDEPELRSDLCADVELLSVETIGSPPLNYFLGCSKFKALFLNCTSFVSACPQGQKNRHQKVDIKKEPISASGSMNHWMPVPFNENIMAKGSQEPRAGCFDRKITIKDNHKRKLTRDRARFSKVRDGFNFIPLIFCRRYSMP